MAEFVQIEVVDGTAIVTITREKALNALNSSVLGELRAAFQELDRDSKVRSVIITGAGDKAFVAGAEITAMQDMTQDEISYNAENLHTAMDTLSAHRKQVIAAVKGFARDEEQ